MKPTDYAAIQPLIVDRQIHHRRVTFTFRCPISDQEIQASATPPQPTELKEVAARVTRRSLVRAVRNALLSTLHRVLGHGFLGRLVAELARSVVGELERNRGPEALSNAELERAAVVAFQTVSARFAWDDRGGRWVALDAARELLSELEHRLASDPVNHPYDLSVLARMMVEVARADGAVSGEEASWLTDYIAASEGSIEGTAARPPLTGAELLETSPEVRENLLMLAWAVALADEQLEAPERHRLESFAQLLRLPPDAAEGAAAAARAYVLEQALERMVTWGGHDAHARDQLMAMAENIGVSREEAERAEARALRRKAHS
jgi:tellurite resistance protein